MDFDEGRIFYVPERDKMGRARWQPMSQPVREALYVAYGWATRDAYAGRMVFYAVGKTRRGAGLPWTYSAYIAQLHQAERRAGVPYVKWRATHGFRRGVAGDVYELTGSDKAAADWIGDESVMVVRRSYLLTRDKAMRAIAEQLEQFRTAPEAAESNRYQTQSAPTEAGAEGVKS